MSEFDNTQTVANASVRRAQTYVEIAPPGSTIGWVSQAYPQSMGAVGSEPGQLGLTNIAACRMGSMQQAIVVSSGDGAVGAPYVATVRVQAGTEAFGFAHVVSAGADPIVGVSITAFCNPYTMQGMRKAVEKSLLVAVWRVGGSGNYTTLHISHNRGLTWQQIWASNGAGAYYMASPQLVCGTTNGRIYLFYRDSSTLNHSLKWVVNDAEDAETWSSTVFPGWDRSGTTTIDLFDGSYYRPYHVILTYQQIAQPSGWKVTTLERTSTTAANVKIRSVSGNNTDPGSVSNTQTRSVAVTNDTPQLRWVSSARIYTDPFQATLVADHSVHLVTYDAGDKAAYISWDESSLLWSSTSGKPIPHNAEEWRAEQDGVWQYTPETGTDLFTNLGIWYKVTTPSTSYVAATHAEMGSTVKLDNHGPTGGDDDVSNNFASFWTRSTEHSSIAFPPFTGEDCTFEFCFQPYKAEYHNIWFVIDDPANPSIPIFKADYYVGSDSTAHPHDTARGLRIWFCKRSTPPNYPTSTPTAGHDDPIDYYRHPLLHCFDGFDDHDDNKALPYFFKIEYDSTADTFTLYWKRAAADSYVPFIPYAASHPTDTREYVDVGSTTSYVASTTEKYHIQERGGLWPRRVYIGCPEVKPALEKQSGLEVGPMNFRVDSQPMVLTSVTGQACLVQRLSAQPDLFYVDEAFPDTVRRQNYGYGWRDVYTATKWHSTNNIMSGPDQAELTFLDIDNFNRTSLFGNVRGYKVISYARAGCADRKQGPGVWGQWQRIFLGIADTGQPVDSGEGPTIVMKAFSPLRDLGRRYPSVTFSALPPPEQVDANGDPIEPPAKDTKKARESQIIYTIDFDAPANPSLPVDPNGSFLMRYDDYIPRYVFRNFLNWSSSRYLLERVGTTISHFSLGGDGGDSDVFAQLQTLWKQLGAAWWYVYRNGRVQMNRLNSIYYRWEYNLGDPPPDESWASWLWQAWTMLSAPLQREEDDWGRSGNVVTTATNMENNPNHAVARTAPWPDGTGQTELPVQVLDGRASQAATAEMYKFDLPEAALSQEWYGARKVQVEVQAWPYGEVTDWVWIRYDNVDMSPESVRDRYAARYSDLGQLWIIGNVEHSWDANSFTTSYTLTDSVPYPVKELRGV